MSHWTELLGRLVEAYHSELSTGDVNRRLSHHICHVAPDLVETLSPGIMKQHPKTLQKYRDMIASIPTQAGPFTPIAGLPPLWLEASSPPFRVSWQNYKGTSSPEGYKADVRILWVSSNSQHVDS